MTRRWQARAVAAGILLAGCGGAQRPRSPGTRAPAEQSNPVFLHEADEEQGPSAAPAGGDAPHSTAPQPAQPGTERVGPPIRSYAQPPLERKTSDELMTLLDDFEVSERLALSDQTGCEPACRALRSMIRSADRLCALANDDRERRICEEARLRVRHARAFVRSGCVQCARGPDLEPD